MPLARPARLRRTGRAAALGGALGLAVALAAGPAAAGKKDDTLRIAWYMQLPTLDQYFDTSREEMIVARQIYDMLIWRDPDSGEYKPLLATAWRWVDNVTLDLDIREGVKFHDGSSFSADDVVYTLNWVSDRANKVPNFQMVGWIEKAEKLGPFQVRIHLKHPFPAALEYLSSAISIYPKAYYAKVGPDGMGKAPVGTGPYKVTAVTPGQSFTLERNDDYFKDSPKGRPAIRRIEQRSLPETQTQILELAGGGVDWIWNVPPDQADKLERLPNVSVRRAETMRFAFIAFDAAGRSGDTPMKDVRVRRAISYAINRQALAKELIGGESRVLDVHCFPSQFGCPHDGAVRYGYDPAKAKALLAEAGYPKGFKIDFYGYRDRRVVEAAIGDLHAVGIDANLSWLNWSTLRKRRSDGQVALALLTFGSWSINDASMPASYYFGGDDQDYARDPKVMEPIAKAGSITDPAERAKLYREAFLRIAEQAYSLPLFSFVTNYAMNSDLEFKPSEDEVARFYRARWK